jgi:hypothetical protein
MFRGWFGSKERGYSNVLKLDYANPKVKAPPFNLPAVVSLILALLGMLLASPPVLRVVLGIVGWPAMLIVLGVPIAGFLLGARADELFRWNDKPVERGSRVAEVAMLLNAVVLVAAVGLMAIVGAAR